MGSSSSYTKDGLSTLDHSTIYVQELVKGGPSIPIPQQFIRLNQEPPPSFSVTIQPLPLTCLVCFPKMTTAITLSSTNCTLLAKIGLVNHGVSSTLLEKLNHEVEEFYRLPLEEKLRYRISEGELEEYATKSRGDGKSTMECYLSELQKLAGKLICLMGKSLKIDEKEMTENFDDGLQAVRMANYPPCPQPELVMALTPHSSLLTHSSVWFTGNVISGNLTLSIVDIFRYITMLLPPFT
ncbi:hypothetical protein F3Y22_tig00110483pilonHSYRG00165 [Hibiscus syriacus]|uniref:Non-haem dioxygenase N-terminal domain-containing protein n=1 Tax=Hibiscus syriacus TaxID=106335 RepID=A0A6A3AE61_HIBSY|nr:hypothetical protein F3Y22_tig00110483pilonHSYRG00165 [Hibiscus syriacus]